MPKSRNRKNHKKKVDARRQRMEHAKRRVEKMQRQLLGENPALVDTTKQVKKILKMFPVSYQKEIIRIDRFF